MNTHILIPIKVFEEGLEHAKENIKEFGQEWFRAADTYSYLKLMSKQISLDEKDKDKDFYKSKAKVSLNERFFDTMQAGEMHCYIEGYKQAQKDLL